MKNINIFFDTNSVKKLDGEINKFELNETYNVVKRFIIENELNNIKVFIPSIVIDELIQQYIEEYKEGQQEIDNQLAKMSVYANRLNWEIEIKKHFNYKNRDYVEYIKKEANRFIEEEQPFLNVVEYPKETKFNKIIERAVMKKKPFFSGRSEGKKFSDAGFKDVVFLECVIDVMEKLKEDFYIISKDKFFSELNLEKEIIDCVGIVISHDTGKKIVEYFKQKLLIEDNSKYIKFVKSQYFKEKIEKATNYKMIESYVAMTKDEYDDTVYINNTSLVESDGKHKEIIVKLSEENDLIEVLEKESANIIYEW